MSPAGYSYAAPVDRHWPMVLIGLISLTVAGWLFRYRKYSTGAGPMAGRTCYDPVAGTRQGV